VDQLLFTQVSEPSIMIAAERCGVTIEKCHTIMEKYGYTGSACIPYGATKAYVLAFSHSLQHELANKGLRIQAVLPGATATDLWESAGLHYSNLPPEIVMSAEEVVDAALVGLDQGELVTIPPLQDGEDWVRFEAARRTLSQRFGHSHPGPRYRAAAVA
jgi:short-subunit dehydrogenase